MNIDQNNPLGFRKNSQEKLTITIRLATPLDWEAFRDLRLQALDSDDQKNFIGKHPEWADIERNATEEQWKEWLSHKDNFAVLTYVGGKLIGSGEAYILPEESQKRYHLGRAYIKKEFQGEGAGKKQFAFRLKEIINRGGTLITHGLWHENKTMLNLSNSFGFKTVGDEPNEYGFYKRELKDLNNPELLKKLNEALNS